MRRRQSTLSDDRLSSAHTPRVAVHGAANRTGMPVILHARARACEVHEALEPVPDFTVSTSPFSAMLDLVAGHSQAVRASSATSGLLPPPISESGLCPRGRSYRLG